MSLAEAVIRFAEKSGLSPGAMLKTFSDLNEARKLFKHSGILVDAKTNAPLLELTRTALDQLCIATVSNTLMKVDQIVAVDLEIVRDHFYASRRAIALGKYRESLEKTASGLATTFFHCAIPQYIQVGKPSSEDALSLSGLGIDPSAFLRMQQYLPTTYYDGSCTWDLRQFGHSANHNLTSAEFCLNAAIDTAIRLQALPEQPTPIDFYHYYEDVTTVTVSSPEAHLVRYGFITLPNETSLGVFQQNDEVVGKVTGRLSRDLDLDLAPVVELENADWIAIEEPQSPKLVLTSGYLTKHVLWFKNKDVSVSYRVGPHGRFMHEHLSEEAVTDIEL